MPGFWICLIIFYVWQAFKDALSPKCAWVLIMAQVYMQKDCMEFWICMGMAQYASIIPQYVSVWLNAIHYVWTWLNIAECPKIYLKMLEETVPFMVGFSVCLIILYIWQGFEYASAIKYARILNIPQYSYNNIITVIVMLILVCWICTYRCSATSHSIFF